MALFQATLYWMLHYHIFDERRMRREIIGEKNAKKLGVCGDSSEARQTLLVQSDTSSMVTPFWGTKSYTVKTYVCIYIYIIIIIIIIIITIIIIIIPSIYIYMYVYIYIYHIHQRKKDGTHYVEVAF